MTGYRDNSHGQQDNRPASPDCERTGRSSPCWSVIGSAAGSASTAAKNHANNVVGPVTRPGEPGSEVVADRELLGDDAMMGRTDS